MKQKYYGMDFMFLCILVFMLLAVMIYGYLGVFTRYMADDYCTSAALRKNGFWEVQQFWWEKWSGRYSFTFVVSFVELFGLRVVPILPALIILAWLFSIIWFLLPVLKTLKTKNYILDSIFIACIVIWVTYRVVDDYPQIAFWQTGILTYPLSPILFLLGMGWVLRRLSNTARVSWLEKCLLFLFALLTGGFSETGVVTQIILLIVLSIGVFAVKNEKRGILSPILFSSLLGSCISLLIIFTAPGNLNRSGDFKDFPFLEMAVTGLLQETVLFIPRLVDEHTLALGLAFFAGVLFVNFCILADVSIDMFFFIKNIGMSLLFVEAGVWAGIAPAYVLRGALPPERVLLFSYFLVVCLLIFWGGCIAIFFRSTMHHIRLVYLQRVSLGLMLVFVALGVVPYFTSQVELISPLMEYSEIWDERHQSLRSLSDGVDSSNAIVVVTDFMRIRELRNLREKLWLTGDFETGLGSFVNRCAAQYYDVHQIIAR